MKTRHLLIPAVLGVGLVLALLWVLASTFPDARIVETSQGIRQKAISANFFSWEVFFVQQQNPVIGSGQMNGSDGTRRSRTDDNDIPMLLRYGYQRLLPFNLFIKRTHIFSIFNTNVLLSDTAILGG